MKRLQLVEISVTVALVLSIVLPFIGFGIQCEDIRNNVIRLHILANSDSSEDQAVKLLVRDAVLNCDEKIFSGEINIENVEEIFNANKDRIKDIANAVLDANGFDYKSRVSITEEYFSTRTYEKFTLPAGRYTALKIVLGNGEGHNWWCVMFPPLCLPAASKNTQLYVVFGENGAEIVSNAEKYEMKFKFVEIFEMIKDKIYGD